MGLNVFGSDPAALTPFDPSSGGGDKFRPLDYVGRDVIFTVAGPKEVKTSFGLKTAVECPKVVVLGETALPLENVLIFSAAIVDQIKGMAGQTFVASIETYDTSTGGKAPRLAKASDAGAKAAEKYLASAA